MTQNKCVGLIESMSQVPYFMKKIPTGAEAANILVGEVGFLEQRIIAFIRLQDGVNLGCFIRSQKYVLNFNLIFFVQED